MENPGNHNDELTSLEMWKLTRELLEFQIGTINHRIDWSSKSIGFMYTLLGLLIASAFSNSAFANANRDVIWIAICIVSIFGMLVPFFFANQILQIHKSNIITEEKWVEFAEKRNIYNDFPPMGYEEESGIFKLRNLLWVTVTGWITTLSVALYFLILK